MKTFKVPFAFDNDGNVIDIDTAEKQKIYYCSCGSEVKLRGGEIYQNHFYHITEKECSLESSIHKAYKSVFSEIKTLKLPFEVNGSNVLNFDSVILEKQIDDFIPDAIGIIGDKKHLIEFAKTSYIGERKENKIKKSNLFCIEIDIIKTVTTIEEIKEHLLSEDYYKHIVHIPEYEEMKALKENYKYEYLKLKHKLDEAEYKLAQYQNTKDNIKHNDFSLFFKCDCKNGAKMYVGELDNGIEVIGFQHKGLFNLKIKNNEF
jgi:hypothetical protein